MAIGLHPSFLLLCLATVAAAQHPVVLSARLPGDRPDGSPGAALSVPESAGCGLLASLANDGIPVPGGGTLSPVSFVNPATANAGALAFFAEVAGSPRNQGVFTADAGGLHVVAMGCGGAGGSGVPGTGCGDPTPVGGTFGGMFAGTFFAPAINAGGDVLFYSEVQGGSSSRGLFLRLAATASLVKIAAIGDASPTGGTFSAVGPGSVGDGGDVVFLARVGAGTGANIWRWKAGVVSKVAAVGDTAPGGGTFSQLGTESLGFVDGTSIPVGPVPAVNASGQVAFRAIVGSSHRLIVNTAGTNVLYLKSGDAVPGGGTHSGFQAPHLNAWGEIAFFSDFEPTPGNFNSGLFVGTPGAWRKAVAFFDPLPGGGQCWGLAFSRNPMTPLDDEGNFEFWANSQYTGGAEQELVLVSRRDGGLETLAAAGQPAPIGGTLGFFNAWVSQRAGFVGVSATTPGAPGVVSAHLALTGALTWEDLGHSLAGAAGLPRLTGEGSLEAGSAGALRLTGAATNAPVWLLAGLTQALVPFKGSVLVPDAQLLALLFASDASGALDLTWLAWPAGVPACTAVVFQEWIVDATGPKGAAASNGLMGRTP